MQITTFEIANMKSADCNRLSPKCKSQPAVCLPPPKCIVTDYRLNANHNFGNRQNKISRIVTDYRLNANHNLGLNHTAISKIVTDYRLNANHNQQATHTECESIVTDYRLNANHNPKTKP